MFFFGGGTNGEKKFPLQNKENKAKQTKTRSGVEKFMQQKEII
jgi:hypothetical protein